MFLTAPALEEILQPGFLSSLFQPIVRESAQGVELDSVEALVRGAEGSLFESASLLCDFARRKKAEVEFDRACIRAALAQAHLLPEGLPISLNVHAATLHHDLEFRSFLRATAGAQAVDLSRLTVEIVEHAPDWADYVLREVLARLREDGVRIALDDIGLGQSSFRMILDVRPDCFKVDRFFVDGCASDPARQAVLAAIVGLSTALGGHVVAEGVERVGDVEAARRTGIDRFQGYLFSTPLRASEVADFASRYSLAASRPAR